MRRFIRYHLSIALPGEVIGDDGKPTFVPLYIKLVDSGNRECTYIRVDAQMNFEEADSKKPSSFVVAARRVEECTVPPILKRAMPRRAPPRRMR
ncbi:MAG: hypothetical protein KJI72_02370 [Patescibacteria group bacterium]|nr:hypothetical protein [Patescibacteria group bacterium]